MSLLEVNKITPQSGTTLTLGDTGDTINFGSGVLPNFENLTVTGDFTVDTNSLKVDSANNRVGIGTASPDRPLKIISTSSAPIIEIQGSKGSGFEFGFGIDSNGGFLQQNGNTNLRAFVNGSERMRIDSSGNVGIGTSSPDTLLHISKSGGAILRLENPDGIVSDNEIIGKIEFEHQDNGGAGVSAFINAFANGVNGAGNISFGTGAPGGNASEVMRITSQGLVGIGTTSPAEELDISADAPSVQLSSTNASGRNYGLQSTNTGNFAFYDGTAGTNRMVIDSSGNVGIGTSSPSEKLEVSTSGTTSIRITGGDSNSQQVKFFSATQQNGAIYSYYNFASPYLALINNGSERMRIDSSGNVGIGNIPETWYSTFSALQIGANKSAIYGRSENNQLSLASNSYVNTSGNNTYINSSEASLYEQNSGVHKFFTAPSGTAGNSITFTERMRIDNSGNVGIGTTPSAWGSPFISGVTQFPKGSIACESNGIILFNNAYYDGTNYKYIASAGAGSYAQTSGLHIFNVASSGTAGNNITFSEAMRIDSSGNVFMAKTTDTITTVGHYFGSNGAVNHVRDGVNVMSLGRKSSDGDILSFYKDSTKVGSIYNGGSNLGIDSSGGLLLVDDIITPTSGADNTKDLGRSSARWKDLYLGGSVYLGGTGSANALDDYEEGTWTPSAETGTITFSNPKYTKIGRQVFLTGSIQSFSNTTTAINVKILGVPFQVDGEASGGVMARYFSGSISGDALTYYMQDNTSQILFYITANNSNFESLQHADLTSGAAQIYFSISYMTD